MAKLTKRQQEILDLIQSHAEITGSPPTRAEIAKKMGFKSPNAAEDHLRALAKKGVIELIPGTSRGIRLTHVNGGIPIVFELKVGPTLLRDDNIQGHYKIERNFFKPGIDFFIQWSYPDMPDLGILEGDYLAIHQSSTAKPEQMVLVRHHQAFSVKRLSSEALQQNLPIEGIVIGLIRGFKSSPAHEK